MIMPESVSRYIGDWLMDQRSLGYILLSHDARVRMWGGALDQLGIKDLQKGKPIADQLFFMEGLLPNTQPFVHLPLIKPDRDHCLDMHLFQTDHGYGLILMDATEKEHDLAVSQQIANDTALHHEKQPSGNSHNNSAEKSETLENFLGALGFAALRLGPKGQLALLGQAPSWLVKLCPQAAAQPCDLSPQNALSFLDNFLHDAHHFWNQNEVGYIKSGLWIETDSEAGEHLLEATALNTGQNKILLISRDTCMIDEKQSLIQKGRELALSQGLGQRLQNELESRVKFHTQELKEANSRLADELAQRKTLEKERFQLTQHLQQAQKMEAIGTLAGGIAHDFNNILSAVIGFSELSLAKIPKDSNLHANIQQVLSAGWRAKGLINQILTFSRQSEPKVQPVKLGLLAIEALKLLRASLPANIDIRQEIQSQGIVMADPTQLHQIIMNLCTNAGQAMRADGGVLHLGLYDSDIGPEKTADNPDLEPGPYLELVVKDSGQGMSAEVLPRIFEPFFSTKPKGQGTGMGLSVVHGIVKSCQGAIQATSQVQVGSTFRVLLPAAPPMASRQMDTARDLPRGTEQILFVDDESAITIFAAKALGLLGYQVKTETDSSLALAGFGKSPSTYDLVITDMNMPKMTGQQLAVEMLKIRPDMPILLCSGYCEQMTDKKAKALGIKGYLMKPIAIKKLAKTVRSILDAQENGIR